ncbi:hypothetical protein K7472_20780 [Streptomyces sp. PTM05]|uniref:DUF4913 domain-containing protein n=1 Tax=Streptantibioticus parmotrematis TaxID=2873249 RepID=A0ABS7QVM4_9ACTN|nr:hypothetical protein [Streptantibioticus parmotrematis]MBY8887258.1 hypothetical protein [Streptantibioticus parmotrematis]
MANGFDDLFRQLATINEEIVSLNAELVLQAERLKILEEDRGEGAGGGSAGAGEGGEEEERVAGAPVRWDDLVPAERVALWREFVVWVIWMADRYGITNDQIPRQCWWQHGAVVEELTALWTSHQSAYALSEDAGSAPYLWQDALARAIERIGRLWVGTCRNGQHRDRHREQWDGDEKYLAAILATVPAPPEGGGEDGDSADPAGEEPGDDDTPPDSE